MTDEKKNIKAGISGTPEADEPDKVDYASRFHPGGHYIERTINSQPRQLIIIDDANGPGRLVLPDWKYYGEELEKSVAVTTSGTTKNKSVVNVPAKAKRIISSNTMQGGPDKRPPRQEQLLNPLIPASAVETASVAKNQPSTSVPEKTSVVSINNIPKNSSSARRKLKKEKDNENKKKQKEKTRQEKEKVARAREERMAQSKIAAKIVQELRKTPQQPAMQQKKPPVEGQIKPLAVQIASTKMPQQPVTTNKPVETNKVDKENKTDTALPVKKMPKHAAVPAVPAPPPATIPPVKQIEAIVEECLRKSANWRNTDTRSIVVNKIIDEAIQCLRGLKSQPGVSVYNSAIDQYCAKLRDIKDRCEALGRIREDGSVIHEFIKEFFDIAKDVSNDYLYRKEIEKYDEKLTVSIGHLDSQLLLLQRVDVPAYKSGLMKKIMEEYCYVNKRCQSVMGRNLQTLKRIRDDFEIFSSVLPSALAADLSKTAETIIAPEIKKSPESKNLSGADIMAKHFPNSPIVALGENPQVVLPAEQKNKTAGQDNTTSPAEKTHSDLVLQGTHRIATKAPLPGENKNTKVKQPVGGSVSFMPPPKNRPDTPSPVKEDICTTKSDTSDEDGSDTSDESDNIIAK